MTTNLVTLADFRPDPGQDLATLIADAIAAGKITIVLGDLGASPGDPQRSAAGALPARADRVLATVLFTDIVGSTERAADLGDAAWRQLLARHDELVRSELERHRGQEVKQTGDGFLATFDGPARAIRCAETIIESVQALGLEVRAGLHSGECEIRNGDVGGMAVHIGSRICALAQPSEVLVSSTVEDLVVGSGIHFEDRGTHELKGVPGSRHLRAVAGEAERAGLTTPLPADERRRKVIDRLALRTIRAARRLPRRTARRVLRD